MAKISFSKLGLKINQDVATFDFNGNTVEVKQYLSIEKKVEMIDTILTNSTTDNGIVLSPKVTMLFGLELVKNYTNISFTPTQLENPNKLYDMIVSSGLLEDIVTAMDKNEYAYLNNQLSNTVNDITTYTYSFVGALDGMKDDYDKLDKKSKEIKDRISDPDELKLLKEVLDKMG